MCADSDEGPNLPIFLRLRPFSGRVGPPGHSGLIQPAPRLRSLLLELRARGKRNIQNLHSLAWEGVSMEPQLGFEVCPSCLDTKSQITTGNWRLYKISQASLGTSKLWLRTRVWEDACSLTDGGHSSTKRSAKPYCGFSETLLCSYFCFQGNAVRTIHPLQFLKVTSLITCSS